MKVFINRELYLLRLKNKIKIHIDKATENRFYKSPF